MVVSHCVGLVTMAGKAKDWREVAVETPMD